MKRRKGSYLTQRGDREKQRLLTQPRDYRFFLLAEEYRVRTRDRIEFSDEQEEEEEEENVRERNIGFVY